MMLTRIDELCMVTELTRAVKKRFRRTDTNVFFLEKKLAPHIARGMLFYKEYEQGVVFFIEEIVYYNICYVWDADSELEITDVDKPMLIEETILEKDFFNQHSVSEKVVNTGFEKVSLVYKIRADVNTCKDKLLENYDERIKSLGENGLTWTFCKDEEKAREVIALWNITFKPYEVPVAHYDFLNVDNEKVLCLENERGEIVGAYWYKFFDGITAEARHLVVRPDYYRRGLGSVMALLFYKDAIESGIQTVYGYINEDNKRSLLMHEKIGFVPNGEKSAQYYHE